MFKLRFAAGVVTALVAAASLTSCAQKPPNASDDTPRQDGKVELQVAWWGSDYRHRLTQDAIDEFESENPNIVVTPTYSDWSGYWDRVAISGAAGDLPDVFQMDEKYLATYAAQDQLADLSKLDGLSTDKIDPSVLPAGEVDGGLYALVASVNTYSLVANNDLLKDAGVTLPDDKTWTWQDLKDVSAQISKAAGDKVSGLQNWGMDDGGLQLWARQHGETLWTEDGDIGVSEETLADWWTYVKSLADADAIPAATTIQEESSSTQEQSGTATNKAALGFWWSNQYASLSESSGDELELVRPPRVDPSDAQTYYKPSMFWSVSAKSAHPEEAAKFVDFIVNSPKAGKILLAERGVPANLDVRKAIKGDLTEGDQKVVDFIDAVSDEVSTPPPMTAPGGSELETVLKRYTLEVLFGSSTPAEAAKKFRAEVQGMLK